MSHLPPSHRWRRTISAVTAVLLASGVAGCSKGSNSAGDGDAPASNSKCDGEVTTLSLAGPNQWGDSGTTFGPAWEDLVARFEADEPCVKVKTIVLPLDSFAQTLSTQLAAGKSSDLVFNAVPHEPHMIYPLTDQLQKPNPYVDGNDKWIDVFNPDYFTVDKVANVDGDVEYIPFNLVGVAVFYNKDAFAKAKLDAPPETFAELLDTCDALSDAGYTPYAMDNGTYGMGWTMGALSAQLMDNKFDDWNVYDPSGEPGKADVLTDKSITRAIATGEFTADLPEVKESLRLTKEMWDHCVDKNWSGKANVAGSVVDEQGFMSQQVAMSMGVNFSVAGLKEADFEVGSMPFPTITKESSDIASGDPARFGTGLGGTAYMIPAKTEGKHLEYAIKFLQYVSAPDKISEWLAASGGIPVLKDLEPDSTVAAFLQGDWAKPMRISYGIIQPPSTTNNMNMFSGYLLGTKSLAEQTAYMQTLYDERAREDIKSNKWSDEDWAKEFTG